MDKKLILVGRSNNRETFDFMRFIINALSGKFIKVVHIEMTYRLRFETPHTKVWFVDEYWSVSSDGVRADAIFGEPYPGLIVRARPGAVIASRDHIGLVDYICQIEKEAELNELLEAGMTVADMYPKTMFMVGRTNGKTMFMDAVRRYENLISARMVGQFYTDTDQACTATADWKATAALVDTVKQYLEDKNIPGYQGTIAKRILNNIYGKPKGDFIMNNATMGIVGCIPCPEEIRAYARHDVEMTKRLAGAYKKQTRLIPAIKAVHFSGPCTVVVWNDGTKTIVRCGENDTIDYEKGFAMAIAKKALGNTGRYYDTFKEHLPTVEEETNNG